MRTRSAASWLLAALAVLAGVVVALPAGAQTDDDSGVALSASVGVDGQLRHGSTSAPVTVTIAARRLVDATLEVRAESQPTVSVDVEVSGGSTADLTVVIPVPIAPDFDVEVTLSEGGDELASIDLPVQPTTETELVGILPGLLRGQPAPGPAPLRVDAGIARFAAVDATDLDDPGLLAAYTVLAAGAAELAALPDTARAAVLDWVSTGGTLLVDGAVGDEVAGLPDAWQPGVDGRSRAGVGAVRVVEGAMSAGQWDRLVEPTPVRTQGANHLRERPDDYLAANAGLRIPELSWLAGFLVLYVGVAVPLTLTALRRTGRGEWGWVALPLVAVMFTSAAWVGGRSTRSGTKAAHLTMVLATQETSVATTTIGVVSGGGGRVRLDAPEGWRVQSAPDLDPPRTEVRSNSDGVTAELALDAGDFGRVALTGPVANDGWLEVTGRGDDRSDVSGTVTNHFDRPLTGVSVFVDGHAVAVGDLDPGQSQGWSVETGGFRADFFHGVNDAGWEVFSFDPDSPVVPAAWEMFYLLSNGTLESPGRAFAAGWTDDESPVDGPGDVEGATLLVSPGDVSLAVGDDSGFGPDRALVRGQSPAAQRFQPDSVMSFRLPDPDLGLAIEPTSLRVTGRAGSLDVWIDGAWRALGNLGQGGRGDFEFGIPEPILPPDLPPELRERLEREGLELPQIDGEVFLVPPQPVPDAFGQVGDGQAVDVPLEAVLDGMVWIRSQDGGPPDVRLELGR